MAKKDLRKTADKLDRRAVDEFREDEITDVYDLLSERVRSAGEAAVQGLKSAAETMQTISSPPVKAKK